MATKTRTKKTSKSERRSITNGLVQMKTGIIDREINLIEAWRKGQNPWLTVEGTERNKPWIRVSANSYWGDYRRRSTLPTSPVGESE